MYKVVFFFRGWGGQETELAVCGQNTRFIWATLWVPSYKLCIHNPQICSARQHSRTSLVRLNASSSAQNPFTNLFLCVGAFKIWEKQGPKALRRWRPQRPCNPCWCGYMRVIEYLNSQLMVLEQEEFLWHWSTHFAIIRNNCVPLPMLPYWSDQCTACHFLCLRQLSLLFVLETCACAQGYFIPELPFKLLCAMWIFFVVC